LIIWFKLILYVKDKKQKLHILFHNVHISEK
jgi:hypothetical protein